MLLRASRRPTERQPGRHHGRRAPGSRAFPATARHSSCSRPVMPFGRSAGRPGVVPKRGRRRAASIGPRRYCLRHHDGQLVLPFSRPGGRGSLPSVPLVRLPLPLGGVPESVGARSTMRSSLSWAMATLDVDGDGRQPGSPEQLRGRCQGRPMTIKSTGPTRCRPLRRRAPRTAPRPRRCARRSRCPSRDLRPVPLDLRPRRRARRQRGLHRQPHLHARAGPRAPRGVAPLGPPVVITGPTVAASVDTLTPRSPAGRQRGAPR